MIKTDANGKLQYIPDAKGNIIPDYSYVGYKNGEVEIPNVPVVKTIYPVAGDNSAHIQAALESFKSIPVNASGFRGALLLKAGYYNIENMINIIRSGIVIKGEGSGVKGTVIRATKRVNILL